MKTIEHDIKTEFYECDCHDRDDMIIARRNLYIYDNPKWNTDMDISLEMVTSTGDWEKIHYSDNIFIKFFNRVWWRIKKATSILMTGKIIHQGNWMPARIDYEKNSLVGTDELRRLGKFLVESADKIEEFYSKSLKITTLPEENVNPSLTENQGK
jgi:hypothetical protein